MPYLTPGVYVEEIPGTPPITGVGTSTAGFIGVVTTDSTMPDAPNGGKYEIAKPNKPQLITNWEQFKSKFGDFQTGNQTLAHAIYGFFLNGGGTCWVARVETMDVESVKLVLGEFERIDEIAIVVAPGTPPPVQAELIAHCEKMRDRFAVLDGQPTETIAPGEIKGTLGKSAYAALYFPYLKVFDPVSKAPDQEFKVPIFTAPPSGHIAGIFSRVDQERGVHKAPANENVRGALGLAYQVTNGEQQELNRTGVNVIRNFNGSILVWGARTLGGDENGEYKYVNVRRLMNFLRESIEDGTRFAVFEPNSTPLWQRIKRSTNAFLTNVWRSGALFGNTPEQAFYVKCDESTNPADVREAGQVVTEIGVAIVKPAEFVVFKISQMTGTTS